MDLHFTSTRGSMKPVATIRAEEGKGGGIAPRVPSAYQCFRNVPEQNPRRLVEAFGRISLMPNFAVPRGSGSAPASCSTSRSSSMSTSRSSSRQSSPSVSRQQSFTFTPPSWQHTSFVSWKPTPAAPRLERTTSTPKLPQRSALTEDDSVGHEEYRGYHETRLPGEETAIDTEQREFMPTCRRPCVAGWAEIESTKVVVFPSGKKFYKCSYCNAPLTRVKNYITTWPQVLFCQQCKTLPQCNSCYKKAVPFIYKDADGHCKRKEAVVNFGGINLCGQCALINPIVDHAAVLDLAKRGREFLKNVFGVKFTEQLLAPHREPEVVSCLRQLRLAADSQGACIIRVDSTPNAAKPGDVGKHSAGDAAELPFDIGPVWHMQLCRGSRQTVYGRCETRALTFPPRQSTTGKDNWKDAAPRTYRVVQRIMLSRGVPECLIYGHLVHELLHAFIWLFLDETSVEIDIAAEEGLCNCILAAALQMRVESLQARREAVLDALLRQGVHPKTDPRIKEVEGVPQAADFLKAVVDMSSRASSTKDRQVAEMRTGTEQSCGYLEHELYIIEYELKILNRRLGEMEKDSHPAYGVGYRTLRNLASRLTVIRLIEILGRHGETLKSVVTTGMANLSAPPVAAG